MAVNLLTVTSPKANEVVGLNEAFAIYGVTPVDYLLEVTVQIDNGPAKQASLNLIPHTKQVLFITSGIATVAGPHEVTVIAAYSKHGHGNYTQNVPIQAQG